MGKKTRVTSFVQRDEEKARRRTRIKNNFPKARRKRKRRQIKQKRILKIVKEIERKREMQRKY